MKAYMIMDGQWGSTGKGLIAGYLAKTRKPTGVVCNFGPNAGHTFIDNENGKMVVKQLPNAIAEPSTKNIYIGPGAILDLDILSDEITGYAPLLQGKSITIHERACVVSPEHRKRESETLKRISSTQKGTGAAQCDKIMRENDSIMKSFLNIDKLGNLINSKDNFSSLYPVDVEVVNGRTFFDRIMKEDLLQIESAQGFELGINSGNSFPYCTSRNVTPIQILSDCGIDFVPNALEVIGSLRTLPIRVGHEYDPVTKEKLGDSGPIYNDQKELSWEILGIKEERTTVTNKIRRIFSFSKESTRRFILQCRPTYIFLNFCNYLLPSEVKALEKTINDITYEVGSPYYGNVVRFTGHGPTYGDVIDKW